MCTKIHIDKTEFLKYGISNDGKLTNGLSDALGAAKQNSIIQDQQKLFALEMNHLVDELNIIKNDLCKV